MNRIATAKETYNSNPTWDRTYGYDHFGNRWISLYPLETLHMATPTSVNDFDQSTNRLDFTATGAVYDQAGNLTSHPHLGSMAYDANNLMASFSATGTTVDTDYDANGKAAISPNAAPQRFRLASRRGQSAGFTPRRIRDETPIVHPGLRPSRASLFPGRRERLAQQHSGAHDL